LVICSSSLAIPEEEEEREREKEKKKKGTLVYSSDSHETTFQPQVESRKQNNDELRWRQANDTLIFF